jgi:dihydrofolate reductase
VRATHCPWRDADDVCPCHRGSAQRAAGHRTRLLHRSTLTSCDPFGIPEDLHRHAVENLEQADALLFGRVTYEMMEAAWRPPVQAGARPDWMEPFARTIDAAKKYVVSSTLDRVDWNAELVRGDLGTAVQQLKRDSGKGLFVGDMKLPLALAELGLMMSTSSWCIPGSWATGRRCSRGYRSVST